MFMIMPIDSSFTLRLMTATNAASILVLHTSIVGCQSCYYGNIIRLLDSSNNNPLEAERNER
jgi:hypothetical protein